MAVPSRSMEEPQHCPWISAQWNGNLVYPRKRILGMEVIWTEFSFMDSWKASVSHCNLLRVAETKKFSPIAGAGKSVLWYINISISHSQKLMQLSSSSIIQDIRDMRKLASASLAFFYCDFRDLQKKERRGLLSSLLVQLCDQSDFYCAVLSDLYSVHENGSQHPSDDELAWCLENMLKLPGQAPVYIIIDGLDECPTTTGLSFPREEVLQLVEKLVGLRLPHLRICVTSRPEADIELVLGHLAFRSISLHGENGQIQDISEYVRSFVHTDSRMRRWKATDKELVIDVLTERADGM
jgi:hypothetical protein